MWDVALRAMRAEMGLASGRGRQKGVGITHKERANRCRLTLPEENLLTLSNEHHLQCRFRRPLSSGVDHFTRDRRGAPDRVRPLALPDVRPTSPASVGLDSLQYHAIIRYAEVCDAYAAIWRRIWGVSSDAGRVAAALAVAPSQLWSARLCLGH